MATDDDEKRLAYPSAALEGLERAIADGIDVRRYLHWNLLDGFEGLAGGGELVDRVADAERVRVRLAGVGAEAPAVDDHPGVRE